MGLAQFVMASRVALKATAETEKGQFAQKQENSVLVSVLSRLRVTFEF